MHGDRQASAVGERQRRPADFRDRDSLAGEAARRGDAERDDRRRFYQFALMVEPDFAALDLVIVRTFMQPALAAHLVLEMLDRIGDEGFVARDAGVLERGIEQAASRADERFARKVFLVARLFADQHDGGVARSLAGNRLGGVAIKRAAGAAFLGFGELGQRLDRLLRRLIHAARMLRSANSSDADIKKSLYVVAVVPRPC